jgi:hypothetical protein
MLKHIFFQYLIIQCLSRNIYNIILSHLDGVVVSVLTLDPRVCKFKPSQGNEFLRVIKIRSTPSFRWGVKPEAPCHKILGHVEDLLTYQRY